MSNAYRSAKQAADIITRTNAHRLLKFYAVECGLKAVYMKRNNLRVLDNHVADDLKHDLNKIMGTMSIGRSYMLSTSIKMSDVKDSKNKDTQRMFSCGELNQAWRYGGKCISPSDSELEVKLDNILLWVSKEIR